MINEAVEDTSGLDVRVGPIRAMKLFIALVIYLSAVDASAKQRAWLGPANFWEGPTAIPRYAHGFASFEDRFLVFGGSGFTG